MIDNRRVGPLAPEELAKFPLTPDTPVWHDGLPDWVTCAELPELAYRFSHVTPPPPPSAAAACPPPQPPAVPVIETEPIAETVIETTVTEEPVPCPPTYMTWSIVATVLCCLPIGVVGIIFASKVTTAWRMGDFRKAEKYSEWTQWCIILSISLGLLMSPIQMILGMI